MGSKNEKNKPIIHSSNNVIRNDAGSTSSKFLSW